MQNQDKHPAHVRSAGQRCDETWNSAPFVCGKMCLCLKKVTWRARFQHILYKLKASFLRHRMRKR